MGGVEEIEVVVAHRERATLRVGDLFLKIDVDQTRTDREIAAMAMTPVPIPNIVWRKPPPGSASRGGVPSAQRAPCGRSTLMTVSTGWRWTNPAIFLSLSARSASSSAAGY
jgi:hypothetical protein